ncbi:MAG: helix-turn-helix transcriptional regulator [Deltaproteobacteria bacterium]|nr:helix-turn-helix transcriptional regulator [Deltaproteobacteria bacterium]
MTTYAGEPPIEQGENFARLVRQEELILEVTEKLTLALDEAGITRTELADRLGRTPGYVSQVFGGGRNLTLRTVADIAAALSMRPTLYLAPEDGPTDGR